MQGYLLDTDICISFLQGKYNIKEKIEEVGIENCFISEITIAELLYGAEKSDNYQKHISEVNDISVLFIVLNISDSLALFAKEKVKLQQKGILIPDFDILIATTAIFHELILVTNNENHMSRLENIKLENWRKN